MIGSHIVAAIKANTAANSKLAGRVYPVCMPLQVPKFPYVIYQSGISGDDPTKDGNCQDYVTSTVMIIEKNYTALMSLSNSVRYSLQDNKADYSGFKILSCYLISSKEQYDMDLAAYVMTLIFNFQTIDKI